MKAKTRKTVGRGKVEIQNQDSHFSTAQNRLRRKEKNCRLHKTLDAPAENYSMIPQLLIPLGWFIWFFPVTAFACAPCYQLEAMRQAHSGSYSPGIKGGQAVAE